METEQNGLRFDIYERVHLSEGVLGIKELESVELVPHIHVLAQGEQAVLRGNLLLTGEYVDDQNLETQTLEHLIPVEITLPMNRVQRVEDIAVEIENFDVDLLSERSLNITGVLSLLGLELSSSSESEPAWGETEEEMVFVHEAARVPSEEPVEEPFAGAEQQEEQVRAAEREQQEEQEEQVRAAQREQRETELAFSAAPAAEAASPLTPREEEPQAGGAVVEPTAEKPEAAPVKSEAAAEPVPEAVQPAQPEEAKKDLKVAFGTKQPSSGAAAQAPTSTPQASGKPFGFTSLFQYAASKSQEREAEEAAAAAAAAAKSEPAEKVEWKNLLPSKQGQRQEFRKLRLVIVQKEDTLETIAKKYDISAREIALHNRLGESELAVGQIVYLPK